MNKVHELKILPQYFQSIVDKSKTFELRKDDRPFASGDILDLHEYNAETGKYTGRFCSVRINHILRDFPGLCAGYCLISITLDKGIQVRKQADYYYCRHMGSYKLYHDNHDGTADKIDQHWDKEVIRKKCYELNGWNYKSKDTKQ